MRILWQPLIELASKCYLMQAAAVGPHMMIVSAALPAPVVQVEQVLEVAQHIALVVWVLTQWIASHVEQLQLCESHQVGGGRQLR